MRTKVLHFVKRLFVALIAVIMTICIPHKAEAKANYKYNIYDLKKNVWTTLKGNGYDGITTTYNLYKISVPQNGYITINRGKYDDIYFYKASIKTKGAIGSAYKSLYIDRKNIFVLPKGDYYLNVSEDSKIKWNFTKASNTTNYCRAKAKQLANGKKETVVFNDGYEFDRWYKVVLKKKKPLTVNLKALDMDLSKSFCVYNSDGEKINCPELISKKTYRTASIPKGTYYVKIKFTASSLWDEYEPRIVQFSWK